MRLLVSLAVLILAAVGLWLVLGDWAGSEREAGPYVGDYSGGPVGRELAPGMGAEASSASRVAIAALPAVREVGEADQSWQDTIVRLVSAGEAGGAVRGDQLLDALAGVIPVRFVSEGDREALLKRTLINEGAEPQIPAGALLMLLEQGGFAGQQFGDKLWIRRVPERR